MEKYEKVLKKDIIFNFIELIILIFIVIASIIVVIKFFSYLDIGFKKRTLYLVAAIFIVFFTVSKTYEISKPLMDIKNNSFITYSGNVVYSYNKSNKHTDILQLVEITDLYVEAPSGTMNPTKNSCIAHVVYGKYSNKVVEFIER